jgi:hypothetical protein
MAEPKIVPPHPPLFKMIKQASTPHPNPSLYGHCLPGDLQILPGLSPLIETDRYAAGGLTGTSMIAKIHHWQKAMRMEGFVIHALLLQRSRWP